MAPLTRPQRRAAVIVLAGGMALRVAWCVYAAREPVGFHDPALYRLLAHQLAHLDGYVLDNGPTAYYPVGYPAALGAVFGLGRLVGLGSSASETFLETLLNLVAAGAGLVLAFAVGRRAGGPWVGVAAAAVVGAMPNLVFHTAVPLSETLFLPVVLGFALVLAAAPWANGGPGHRRLVAAGVLLGASAYIRPVALPALALLPLVWLSARLGWRRAMADVALVGVVTLGVLAPWTVRNALRMNAFVPLSSNTGDNLCMSRQPGATGAFLLSSYCHGGDELEGVVRPAYETRRDAKGRRLAIDFVRDDPAREIGLWPDRLGATFRHDHDGLDAAEGYGSERFLADGARDLLRRSADGAWYVLGALSIVAAAAVVAIGRLRRAPELVLLVVLAVGLLLPVVAFFGDARFKVPAVPVLAVLVCAVAPRLRGR